LIVADVRNLSQGRFRFGCATDDALRRLLVGLRERGVRSRAARQRRASASSRIGSRVIPRPSSVLFRGIAPMRSASLAAVFARPIGARPRIVVSCAVAVEMLCETDPGGARPWFYARRAAPSASLRRHGLNRGQHILDAVLELVQEQFLARLGAFQLRDVLDDPNTVEGLALVVSDHRGREGNPNDRRVSRIRASIISDPQSALFGRSHSANIWRPSAGAPRYVEPKRHVLRLQLGIRAVDRGTNTSRTVLNSTPLVDGTPWTAPSLSRQIRRRNPA
jgi:hypothetical protein